MNTKQTIRKLAICERCNGVAKFTMYNPDTEESYAEDCSLCKGMGIVLKTITIECAAVTVEQIEKMREVKYVRN